MARIPDEVVERLKREVAIERLAEARGIDLKRHGADLIGRCPFHDDKTPSLVITPAKNLWHCLGACQAGGTVIDWVMKAEGVSFRHAVELLQNDYAPVAAPADAAPAKRSTVRKLSMALEREAEDSQLLARVIDYHQHTLLQSPEAMQYLEKRGIASQDAVRTFKLGYANRTLGYRSRWRRGCGAPRAAVICSSWRCTLIISTRRAGCARRGRARSPGAGTPIRLARNSRIPIWTTTTGTSTTPCAFPASERRLDRHSAQRFGVVRQRIHDVRGGMQIGQRSTLPRKLTWSVTLFSQRAKGGNAGGHNGAPHRRRAAG